MLKPVSGPAFNNEFDFGNAPGEAPRIFRLTYDARKPLSIRGQTVVDARRLPYAMLRYNLRVKGHNIMGEYHYHRGNSCLAMNPLFLAD